MRHLSAVAAALIVVCFAFAAQSRPEDTSYRFEYGAFTSAGKQVNGRYVAAGARCKWVKTKRGRIRSCSSAAPYDLPAAVSAFAAIGAKPFKWCGWAARKLVAQRFGNDPGPNGNKASWWARWGKASGPTPGAIAFNGRHVGMVVAVSGDTISLLGGNQCGPRGSHARRNETCTITQAIGKYRYRVAAL